MKYIIDHLDNDLHIYFLFHLDKNKEIKKKKLTKKQIL